MTRRQANAGILLASAALAAAPVSAVAQDLKPRDFATAAKRGRSAIDRGA